MKNIDKKSLTLKTLNKSNVWDIQENDIFRMLEAAEKDADIKENLRHYIDIIKSAFDVEELKVDRPELIKKYEARGYKVNPGHRPQLRRRMGFAVTKHTGHNPKRFRHQHHHTAQRPSAQARRNV